MFTAPSVSASENEALKSVGWNTVCVLSFFFIYIKFDVIHKGYYYIIFYLQNVMYQYFFSCHEVRNIIIIIIIIIKSYNWTQNLVSSMLLTPCFRIYQNMKLVRYKKNKPLCDVISNFFQFMFFILCIGLWNRLFLHFKMLPFYLLIIWSS
jgi:hypothetical protein